jgi:ParB-like chromosome segregation protein Spo0J
MESVMIPVNQLKTRPEYKNLFPPLTDDEYRNLKNDIVIAGIHTPLIVERWGEKGDGGYVVLAGHHRQNIAIETGLPEVPCRIATTIEQRISALFDNIHRRQLTESDRRRLQQQEKTLRETAFSRLIPGIQELLIILPHEVRLRLAQASVEEQEDYLREWLDRADRIKLNGRGAKASSGGERKPTLPAGSDEGLRQHRQEIARLESQLQEFRENSTEEIAEIRKINTSLSKTLKDRDQTISNLEGQVESLEHQVTGQTAEAKAAHIVVAERMSNADTLSPEQLLNSLEYSKRFLHCLAIYAAKLPALGQTDRETAMSHLKELAQSLSQIEESLEPHHKGPVPSGTSRGTAAAVTDNGQLSLIGPTSSRNGRGRRHR